MKQEHEKQALVTPLVVLVILVTIVLCAVSFSSHNQEMINTCTKNGLHYHGGSFVSGVDQDYSEGKLKIRCEDDNGHIHWVQQVQK